MGAAEDWEKKLRSLLGRRRFTVACLGSKGMGDDAAGLVAAEELRRLGVEPLEAVNLLDLVGPLRRAKAEAAVIVDAVLSDAPPGSILVFEAQELDEASPLASTHRVPPSLLEKATGVPVVVVGIAAASLAPGPPSRGTVEAARRVARVLAELSRAYR